MRQLEKVPLFFVVELRTCKLFEFYVFIFFVIFVILFLVKKV